MATRPYTVVLTTTLTGSGSGTVSYQMPATEELHIHAILQKSTGEFAVTDIRDSAGRHYTNASASTPLPGEAFTDVGDSNTGMGPLAEPLVVEGGLTLTIALVDESTSSNTVELVLVCIRGDTL